MITRAEAIDMYNSNDLIGIGMEAGRGPPQAATPKASSATSSIATLTTTNTCHRILQPSAPFIVL